MRNAFRGRAILGATVFVCLAACSGESAPVRAPQRMPAHNNVILVLSDALRAASLPMYGYPRDNAPRLAQLAAEGVVFEHHVAHYPGTTVSVSQMLTGRWSTPLLVGQEYLSVPLRSYPKRMLLLPQALKQHGYRTGLVSSHFWFADSQRLLAAFEEARIVDDPASSKGYAEFDKLFPAVVEFLDAAADDARPFFLYLHSMDTHGPNDFHAGFDRLRNASGLPEGYDRYDAEIEFTDHWIGKIVDELRRRDLLETTVLAVTADHGEDFNEMGPERWNRNHGLHVRRSQVHVPLLLRLPGAAHAGLRYRGVSGQVDVAPTLLRLGVAAADLHPFDLDGVDLTPQIQAGNDGRDSERTQLAFSARYWGIYERQHELHYDSWEKSFSPLLRVVPDMHNYPRLETVGDPVRETRLRAALEAGRRRELQRQAQLPWIDRDSLPQRVQLPILIDVTDSSEARPTFADLPDDQRWYLPGPYLRAAPAEQPAPIELSTDWLPGTYRVVLLLDRSGIRDYAQQFQVSFPGAPAARVMQVQGPDEEGGNRVELGVHDLPHPLVVRISEPRGGVSIAGLELERSSEAPAAPIDAAKKERLRQLGYE